MGDTDTGPDEDAMDVAYRHLIDPLTGLPNRALMLDRIDQRDKRTGDSGGTRAAVGLQHVAIKRDHALAQSFEVDRGPQRATDQALNFQRAPPLTARRRLAAHSTARGTWQHAVLRSDPTLALPLEKHRHPFFHAGVAQHNGVAELHQHRSLGVLGEVSGEPDGAHLIG